MIDKNDIDKLSSLARIAVSEEEKEAFLGEIDSILSYVSHIEEASSEVKTDVLVEQKNMLRDDSFPHETGLFTEKLLKEAPAVQDGFIRVKKILPS